MEGLITTLKTSVDAWIRDLQKEIQSTRQAHHLAEARIRELEAECRSLEKKVAQAEETIHSLREEQKSFMSVSRIVSLTNENSKMKEKIALLESIVARRQSSGVVGTPSAPLTTTTPRPATPSPLPSEKEDDEVAEPETKLDTKTEPEIVIEESPPKTEEEVVVAPQSTEPADDPATDATTDEAEETENPDEAEITLYEKTIKGVTYYVGEENNVIYKKEADDSLGDQVGYYKVGKDGKRKIVWL